MCKCKDQNRLSDLEREYNFIQKLWDYIDKNAKMESQKNLVINIDNSILAPHNQNNNNEKTTLTTN